MAAHMGWSWCGINSLGIMLQEFPLDGVPGHDWEWFMVQFSWCLDDLSKFVFTVKLAHIRAWGLPLSWLPPAHKAPYMSRLLAQASVMLLLVIWTRTWVKPEWAHQLSHWQNLSGVGTASPMWLLCGLCVLQSPLLPRALRAAIWDIHLSGALCFGGLASF